MQLVIPKAPSGRRPNDAPVPSGTNRPASSHLCFTVGDIRSAYDDLRRKGVRFKSEPVAITSGPNAGGFVVYLFDPDGYTLEIFQPPSE